MFLKSSLWFVHLRKWNILRKVLVSWTTSARKQTGIGTESTPEEAQTNALLPRECTAHPSGGWRLLYDVHICDMRSECQSPVCHNQYVHSPWNYGLIASDCRGMGEWENGRTGEWENGVLPWCEQTSGACSGQAQRQKLFTSATDK